MTINRGFSLFGILFFLESFSLFAQEPEITRSDDYAVRRYQEVVDSILRNEPETPQERLIQYRAKLVIAERNLIELKSRNENANIDHKQLNPRNLVKATQAEIDHYSLKIRQLEKNILFEKQKEKNKLNKKSKK